MLLLGLKSFIMLPGVGFIQPQVDKSRSDHDIMICYATVTLAP